nr:heavy metal-associated isoprenylated plant protein 32-like [Ipomoea trifida]
MTLRARIQNGRGSLFFLKFLLNLNINDFTWPWFFNRKRWFFKFLATSCYNSIDMLSWILGTSGQLPGVYIIKFEEEMGKVTVSGDVVPETLIRKLNKNGKHAELIGGTKENNGERVEDSKGAKRKKGGGQNDRMTKLPPRYNVPVNGIQKSVKFDLPESDDVIEGYEEEEEEGGMDDVVPVNKTNQPPMVGNGGGAGISMINDRARAAHVTPPNRMALKAAPGGNVGPTGGMPLPIPQRSTQVGPIPNFQIPTPQHIPATAVHVGGAGGGATVQGCGAAVHAGYYPETPARNPLQPQQPAVAANSYPQPAMYFRTPPAVGYFPPSPLYPSYPYPPPQDNYYSDDENTTGCSVM